MNDDTNYGCTILIPTYNRSYYLRRILSYYNEYAGNYDIIVADSSSDENKKRNKKIISLFSNINILYINYHSEIHPHHKFTDALNHVNTKYCVFCADDDFVAPNGIDQSTDFLEKNPDFTVAHGYYISFYLKNDKRKKQHFYWDPIYPYKSITFPDAEHRLTEHFSNYSVPTFYAVHRTDFLKMIFKETMDFTDDYRFGELLPSVLTLIHGKMKCLDVLYTARESIPASAGGRAETIRNFVKNGSYNEKYVKFRDCLVVHLSKMSQLEVEESKKVVDKAMSSYTAKYPKDYKSSVIHKMKEFLDHLRLPEKINRGIKAVYRKLFLPKQKDSFLNLKSSIENPSSKYYDDFNKIRLHVLTHPIQRRDEKRKFS